jgi:hypothetical protein
VKEKEEKRRGGKGEGQNEEYHIKPRRLLVNN